jgi:photosystem II stability/assembly factor-like uncharacterized protein
MWSMISKIMGMKKIYILLIVLFMMNGAMGQWIPQNSGTTNFLNSIFFTDANKGNIVGSYGTILNTTDGGTNWELQYLGTSVTLYSVHFPKPDTGYALGAPQGYPSLTAILKTTDGGVNWTTQHDSLGVQLNSVYFTDASTGYVVGENGTILKTTDGGINWIPQNSGTNYPLSSVHFPAKDTGFFVVGDNNSKVLKIFKTEDGGVSWIEKYSDSITGNPAWGGLSSIHFPDVNTGYAVGHRCTPSGCSGIIRKTSDGGSNWINLDSLSGGTLCIPNIQSVYFTDANTGYIVGDYTHYPIIQGYIQITIDGGTNWTTQYDNVGVQFTSVYFPCYDTGYAVGHNQNDNTGLILKTTNGGYPAGTIDFSSKLSPLKIYPNPASNTITIETPTKGHLNILNLNGKVILQQEITESKTTFDISILASGVYLVRVMSEKVVQVGKFVKQ